MSLSTMAARALLIAATAIGFASAQPASAQLSLGSPGEPPRLELGAGAFDIKPSHQKDSVTQGMLSAEYHFGDLLWIWSPFVGAEVTTKGATYAYFGFGFDINFGPNWVLTPNGAAGWYQRGDGSTLGSWWEFRTGAELDYKFADLSRLGLSFHHISNAGLTRINPGEEDIELVYSIPLRW